MVIKQLAFEPLNTSTLELELVFAEHHGEGEYLLFHLQDVHGTRMVLRYDITVPIHDLPKTPMRLFDSLNDIQMQMVYYDDTFDKGHFQEFMQCGGD